jgi:hypothetical protein
VVTVMGVGGEGGVVVVFISASVLCRMFRRGAGRRQPGLAQRH